MLRSPEEVAEQYLVYGSQFSGQVKPIANLILEVHAEILREVEAICIDECKAHGLPLSCFTERIRALFHRDPPVPAVPSWFLTRTDWAFDDETRQKYWAEVCRRMELKK